MENLYKQYYKDLKTDYTISGRNYINEKAQLDTQMEAWASEFIEQLRYFDEDIKKPEDITRKLADQFARQKGLKKDKFFQAVERIKKSEWKKKI